MHSVTAATIAAGGGARAAERADADGVRARSLGTLAFSERGTGAHFYAPGAEGRCARTAASRSRGARASSPPGGHADVYLVLVQGEAEGTADAYLLAERPHRRARSTAPGAGSAWPATRASRSSSTTSSSATTIGSAPPGEAIGARLRRGRTVLPRRPRRRQRRHRRRRGRGGDRARAGPPLPGRLVARRGPVRAAPDRRHGSRRRGRPACSCARRRARRGGRRVGARRDHGGEGRRDRGRRRP